MHVEIIRGEEGKIAAQCAFCVGKGTDPFDLLSKISICQVCGGRGEVNLSEPAIRCVFCGGTGIHRNRRLTCTVCGGKGMTEISEPVEPCPECKGLGVVAGDYLPCLTCRGKGVVGGPWIDDC